MKKQWMIAIILCILLLTGAGVIVYAEEPLYSDQTMVKQTKNIGNIENFNLMLPFSNDISRLKFRGIWGYEELNETEGYLGGVLIQRTHVIILKGLWNTTDNMTKGTIVGILKRGYFNGRLLTQNQTIGRIVGLYRFDAEQKILQLHWMIAKQTGWAHCRILMNA